MTIHKKTKFQAGKRQAEDAFLAAAPDVKPQLPLGASPSEKGIAKGNKRQISITIDPVLLSKLDAKATEMGMGRSAFITLCVFQSLTD